VSGSSRKATLIAAAQQAMAEHGSGVRLRQIAERAGVSPGAVLYHYPDLAELLIEANRAGVERFCTARMAALAGLSDPADRLIRTILLGVPRSRADEGVRLLCSLGGEASRNTVYAILLTALFDRQVHMYTAILDSGAERGAFRLHQSALAVARNLVALEDAYGYRIMAGHPALDYEAAVGQILGYARLATGHPLPHDTSSHHTSPHHTSPHHTSPPREER